MKILLIGANGQLGTDLFKVFNRAENEVFPVLHSTHDVCSAAQVEDLVDTHMPDLIINTAAFHKVEECEKNPGLAFEVNATGAFNLARASRRHGAILVHFSSDYVFSGEKRSPYAEFDRPTPLNVYGASKVAGEHLIACGTDRFFVVRTTGLYGYAGSSGKGGNFVETMLKKASERASIRVVNDQTLTPTSTLELAQTVSRLVETDAFGLYHITCEGECSWYDFAGQIFAMQKLEVDLAPAATIDFPSNVKRPPYSVLSKNRLHNIGLSMPFWQTSLERYLHGRVHRATAAVSS